MTEAEKRKVQFQRPKRWFKKTEWALTRHQQVFGFTASNGKQLAFLVPSPWNATAWAELIRTKLAPWLRRIFPEKRSFRILLDGEKVLHAPQAKAAYRAAGIVVESGWPGHSPDLNPQENVWSKTEPILRKRETGKESFETWKTLLIPAVTSYETPEKLVGSMANRVAQCIERKGAATDY